MPAIELVNTPLFNDANLVYYYRFEGNSNDSKGSNNGTDTDITYGVGTGVFGQGAAFNGTTSKVALGTVPTLTHTSFSISLWFKVTDFLGVYELFSEGNTGTNNPMIQIAVADNATISLANRDDTATGLDGDVTVSTLSAATFYHLVWTCTTTSSILYINGSAVGSPVTFTENTGTFNVANFGVLQRISSIRFLKGSLDDLAIFSRILTATEVSNLYNGTWSTGYTKSFMTPNTFFWGG